MASVSTKSVYSPDPDPCITVREEYSPMYEDFVYTHDYTERDALLADGWEPVQVDGWTVTLKRLKPCEECKKPLSNDEWDARFGGGFINANKR